MQTHPKKQSNSKLRIELYSKYFGAHAKMLFQQMKYPAAIPTIAQKPIESEDKRWKWSQFAIRYSRRAACNFAAD